RSVLYGCPHEEITEPQHKGERAQIESGDHYDRHAGHGAVEKVRHARMLAGVSPAVDAWPVELGRHRACHSRFETATLWTLPASIDLTQQHAVSRAAGMGEAQ